MTDYNRLGQPIGFPLADWKPRQHPPRNSMSGRYCVVVPIDVERHAVDLFAANQNDREGRSWTYLAYGPFGTVDEYRDWMRRECLADDPLFHTIIDSTTGRAGGVASFLRIDPDVGRIEVGHIHYSPLLQRTRAATEAMYLMMSRVFDELGYRRYEWKCDALNHASRRAAERLGFQFEGIFRQAALYKNRNRDTAWYSIIDKEWPMLKAAFEAWLDGRNFTKDGEQIQSLEDLQSLTELPTERES